MNRETMIQATVLQYLGYLEARGDVYFFRSNSFSGFLQRYNGSVGRINNSKRGNGDLTLCYKGRFLSVEIKTATGRQSKDQIEAQKKIERAGGLYKIVRSAEELRAFLESLDDDVAGAAYQK